MPGRVNCTGTVKDKITRLNRQCRNTASADQTPTLCHICLRKLQRSSNPHIAAESNPGVAAESNPDVAAGPDLHIATEFNPAQPNLHIAAEPTPPATPIDLSDTTTGISATPIASQNAALALTPRKAGQNVATTDTTTTPHKASQLAPTHATTHFPTPQKAIQQSSTDDNLAIRRDVFRNNLKELILVKMECEKKIDFLYGKVEGAVAWEKLDNMKESLLISKAWQDWLTDMTQPHDLRTPLRAQEKFIELLTTAQSILVENKKGLGAEPYCFRNINDEKIDFNAPHDPQKSLKPLRPDIAVVKREHLDSQPPLYGQFLCVMEHKQSDRLRDGRAIQDSLIKSVQIFNDNFFRQYLYSVFIAGTSLRLFQLDRGGIAYFANGLNIEKHPEAFLKFVAWLSFSPPEQLGYEAPPDNIGGVPIECEWDKPSTRPHAEVLDARGTTVWTARKPEPVPTEPKPVPTELDEGFAQLTLNDKILGVVKMQWAYEARKTTEADFLHAISGVTKLIANHEGVSTKDFGTSGSKIKRMPFKLKAADAICVSEGSYATLPKDIDSINLNDDINLDDSSTDEQVFRQQRWILISYCGASIDDESDPISGKPFATVDRLRALRSVICTINELFCEKRIVHRDISVNNIRIAPASDSKHLAGNLIDFDMASYWDAGGSGAKSRTGTPQYMAVIVLCSAEPLPCHLPWYDIESVFWVLLIVEGKRSGEKFKGLTGTDLVSFGRAKLAFVLLSWRELMKSAFMQGPVGKLLCRLRGFLFDSQWTPTKTLDARIVPDLNYETDRFKTGKEDETESERWKDMAHALKEGVKIIGTWFDECINELLASENTK